MRRVHDAIDLYSSEAAQIVEDFAGGWYAKRQWAGGLDRTEGVAFVALRKIADELTHAS